jgi:hypothetical protein
VAVLVIPLVWAVLTLPIPSFGSVPAPPDVSFVALGDAGTGSPAQAALRDQLVRRAGEYDLALFLGDNADPGSTTADYALNLFGVYGSLIQAQGQPPPRPGRSIPKPAYAVAGDHETARDPTADGLVRSFVNPENGPKGVEAERFYAFDVGAVHFVALDSPILLDPLTPRAQIEAIRNWLIADLDQHLAGVTVAFDHHPFFGSSVGPVGPAADARSQQLAATWFPLLVAHGVDVILSAHDPSYQRNVAMAGVTTYVVGSSGAEPRDTPAAPYAARQLAEGAFLAVEVRGCTISTRAVRADGSTFDPWTFSAPTCASGARDGELFGDGFETGDFAGWTTVQVGIGGSAGVDAGSARQGGYGARLSAHGDDGYAYARRQLAAPETDLVVAASFRVVEEGPSGGNIPLLRLFDDTGARILSLYRQNLAASKLYVSHGDRFDTTTGVLPLGTWARVEVRIAIRGGSATVEARLNGVRIYETTAARVSGTGVRRIQIGNDTAGQSFALQVDDVSILDAASTNPSVASSGGSAPPDGTGVPPTIEPSPQPTLPSSSPLQSPDVLLNDGFESHGLASWTVISSGDGRAAVDRTKATHGLFSAHLVGGWSTGSSIAIRQALPALRPSLTVGADVLLAREGPAGGNAPLLRLLDAGGGRLVSVQRQNANADHVYVTFGGITYLTTGALPLGQWSTIRLSLADDGTTAWVVLSMDGREVFRGSSPQIAGRGAAAIQLGNETKAQPLDLYVDEALVQVP